MVAHFKDGWSRYCQGGPLCWWSHVPGAMAQNRWKRGDVGVGHATWRCPGGRRSCCLNREGCTIYRQPAKSFKRGVRGPQGDPWAHMESLQWFGPPFDDTKSITINGNPTSLNMPPYPDKHAGRLPWQSQNTQKIRTPRCYGIQSKNNHDSEPQCGMSTQRERQQPNLFASSYLLLQITVKIFRWSDSTRDTEAMQCEGKTACQMYNRLQIFWQQQSETARKHRASGEETSTNK